MTTIDELAETILEAHDLDTMDAARDVVNVHLDQIRDDEDLWMADSMLLTAAGAEVVTGAIAESLAQGLYSTRGQHLLNGIADVAAAIARSEQATAEHVERRDDLIRKALKTDLSRVDIAAAARVKPARLYQIRDGRR